MGKTSPDRSALLRLGPNVMVPTLLALEDVGFTPDIFWRIRSDQQFCSILGQDVANAGIRELPAEEIRLSEYLGEEYPYFGVRAWSEAFWIFLTPDQLDRFPKFPWPLELLEEDCPISKMIHGKCRERNTRYIPIKESHSIFLGLDKAKSKALTPKEMQRLANEHDRGCNFASETIGKSEFFSTQHAAFRWYMIFEVGVCKSNEKDFSQQISLLSHISHAYEVPSAAEAAQCHYLCKNKHGGYPLDMGYVRTSTRIDLPEHNNPRIVVGKGSPPSNFNFGFVRDEEKDYHVRIAASRIPGK